MSASMVPLPVPFTKAGLAWLRMQQSSLSDEEWAAYRVF
jgi:hypothetical protein